MLKVIKLQDITCRRVLSKIITIMANKNFYGQPIDTNIKNNTKKKES